MATDRDDHDVSSADAPGDPSTARTTTPPTILTPEEAAEDLAMTSRYTDAEWESFIAAALPHIKPSVRARHRVPGVDEGQGAWALAKTIDHTLLKLDATERQIDGLCEEARRDQFMSVCVRLPFVSQCVSNLRGTPIRVACVVGFHEGTPDTRAKCAEASAAIRAGALELDIVLDRTLLFPALPPPRSQSPSSLPLSSAASTSTSTPPPPPANAIDPAWGFAATYSQLAALRSIAPPPVTLKLILETSQLPTPAHIVTACALAHAARFDFVKTSTGFEGRGASVEDVRLMSAAAAFFAENPLPGTHAAARRRYGFGVNRGAEGRGAGVQSMEVKASGGVRGYEDAVRMLEAGATRIGTSSGVWIVKEGRERMEIKRKGGSPERPGGGMTRLYTDNSVDGY